MGYSLRYAGQHLIFFKFFSNVLHPSIFVYVFFLAFLPLIFGVGGKRSHKNIWGEGKLFQFFL